MKIKLVKMNEHLQHLTAVCKYGLDSFAAKHASKKLLQELESHVTTLRECVQNISTMVKETKNEELIQACPDTGFVPAMLRLKASQLLAEGSAARENLVAALEQLEKDLISEIEIKETIPFLTHTQVDAVQKRMETFLEGSPRTNETDAKMSDAEWKNRAIGVTSEMMDFVYQVATVEGKSLITTTEEK
jgi:hypothetical protein